MSRVIESHHTEGRPEADGRTLVRETHTTDDGESITFEWLRDGQDIALVLQARAAELNRQYEAKESAEAVIDGTLIPMSHLEFRNLFKDKREGIDEFNATFETNGALTAQQKSKIRTGLEDFRHSKHITRPFKPEVLEMVNLYKAMGLLTDSEAAAVLAAGA